jgi:hypothetical protein
LSYRIGAIEAEYRLDIPAGTEVEIVPVYGGPLRINGAVPPPGSARRVLGAGKWHVTMRA